MLQLYRVNVLLQSPDAPELTLSTPPFFILRRYSQFRQLYDKVRRPYPGLANHIAACSQIRQLQGRSSSSSKRAAPRAEQLCTGADCVL